jgi:hypothetical protein
MTHIDAHFAHHTCNGRFCIPAPSLCGVAERKSLRKAEKARQARLSAEAEYAENRVKLDAVLAQ